MNIEERPEKPEVTKQLILDKVSDLVSDFLYYDRKEDSVLSIDDLKNAIKTNVITIDKIVEEFRKYISENILY